MRVLEESIEFGGESFGVYGGGSNGDNGGVYGA